MQIAQCTVNDICEHINFKLYFTWHSAILVLSIADYFLEVFL